MALEVKLFTLGEENIAEFNGIQCSICQSGYSLRHDAALLKCKHVFHVHCVERWFERVN